jgi:hypothetical protein
MLEKNSRNRKYTWMPLIFVAACGGGGGGESSFNDEPVQVNRPPTVTIDAVFQVNENSRLIGNFEVEDDDSSDISLSVEGADAREVVIESSFRLMFVESKDFETPSDVDQNNVYEFRLVVSDGQNRTEAEVFVELTDLVENKLDQSELDESLFE